MLQRILNAIGYERRSSDPLAPGNWARGYNPAPAVSPSAVLSNIAVAARCVSLRSELLASVPLKLYRRLPNGDKERVTDSPLALVLGDLANPLMTAFELREFLVRSLDLQGNAYARIVRDGAGQVTELWPIQASMVTVERLESGRLRYRVSQQPSGTVILLQEEVLHIRASSEDGLLGRSPIAIARGVLGRAIAEAVTAHTGASNSFRIAGVVTVPNAKIAPGSRQALEQAFEEDAMRADDARRVKVLEGGAKFQPVSFSSADAEFLESRKLSNEDVARIFNCTPASVGILSSVSYGSADADARALVQNCLQPLAERVEQAFMRCLLTPEGRRQYVIEHDLKGLLRGDTAQRFASYEIGRRIGIFSQNDLRRYENEPLIEDGDTYLQPQALAGSSAPRGDPQTE
ncbi:MAG: phage portal protein [Hyphomonas sp.]